MAVKPKNNKVVNNKIDVKKENKEVEIAVEKKEINIDELVALKVAEILAQKELENKESNIPKIEEKTIPVKKSIKPSERIRNRKFVPDNTLIRLEQNIDGKFIIKDDRGSNYFVELTGYGDTTTMSFKDLKNFHGRNHTFLNKGKLKILDVVSENGDVDFEDVIEDLNLQRIYNDDKKISPIDIEHYLLEEESLNEFSSKIRSSKEILEVIVEIAHILYTRGEFNNNSKMDVLRQVSGNYDLFTFGNSMTNITYINNPQ